MKRVLNVGGNDKAIPIPDIYRGWEHLMLEHYVAHLPPSPERQRDAGLLPA